jgi:hypothetical protein
MEELNVSLSGGDIAKLWRKIVKPFRASQGIHTAARGAALLVDERITTLSWAPRSSLSNRREGSDHTEVLEMLDVLNAGKLPLASARC